MKFIAGLKKEKKTWGKVKGAKSIKFFFIKSTKNCASLHNLLCTVSTSPGSISDGSFQIRQGTGLVAKDHSVIPIAGRHIFVNTVIPFDQFCESKIA